MVLPWTATLQGKRKEPQIRSGMTHDWTSNLSELYLETSDSISELISHSLLHLLLIFLSAVLGEGIRSINFFIRCSKLQAHYVEDHLPRVLLQWYGVTSYCIPHPGVLLQHCHMQSFLDNVCWGVHFFHKVKWITCSWFYSRYELRIWVFSHWTWNLQWKLSNRNHQ